MIYYEIKFYWSLNLRSLEEVPGSGKGVMELNVAVEVSSVALDEGFDVIVKMVKGFVDGDGGTFVVFSVETENCLELHLFSVGIFYGRQTL